MVLGLRDERLLRWANARRTGVSSRQSAGAWPRGASSAGLETSPQLLARRKGCRMPGFISQCARPRPDPNRDEAVACEADAKLRDYFAEESKGMTSRFKP